MRSPRAGHGCAATEHGYVVAGGADGWDNLGGFGYLHTVDYYTFPQPSDTGMLGSWSTLPQLPRAWQYTGLVYSYEQLIVVGGKNNDDYPYSSLYINFSLYVTPTPSLYYLNYIYNNPCTNLFNLSTAAGTGTAARRSSGRAAGQIRPSSEPTTPVLSAHLHI